MKSKSKEIRRRFFHLCTGPLQGRVLAPASTGYRVTAGGSDGTRLTLVIPDERETTAAGHRNASLAARNAEHIYEAYEIVDEVWLEIVLCRYVTTREQFAAGQN